MDREKLENDIRKLLDQQRLAVLATVGEEKPYTSLIAFDFTSDLSFIYFATPRETRKYANLISQPFVAFLIDSRTNSEKDFYQAAALTVQAMCQEISGEGKNSACLSFIERHPSLKNFVELPTTALIQATVEKYIYVKDFQQVYEYKVGYADSKATVGTQ